MRPSRYPTLTTDVHEATDAILAEKPDLEADLCDLLVVNDRGELADLGSKSPVLVTSNRLPESTRSPSTK